MDVITSYNSFSNAGPEIKIDLKTQFFTTHAKTACSVKWTEYNACAATAQLHFSWVTAGL